MTTELKFIKDHPSRKFKKGHIVIMPNENVDAWVKSGYAIVNKVENVVGNVEASSESGGVDSKLKSNKQLSFGVKKNKKKKKKR